MYCTKISAAISSLDQDFCPRARHIPHLGNTVGGIKRWEHSTTRGYLFAMRRLRKPTLAKIPKGKSRESDVSTHSGDSVCLAAPPDRARRRRGSDDPDAP